MAAQQPAARDYVQIAREYALAATRDKKRRRHGRLIRQAARRYLDDLKRAKKQDCKFIFEPGYAEHACEFIEMLPHVEGVWDPPTIVLDPSQVFFVVQLFGFRQRANPMRRRFTSALLAVARKFGKSTLAGAIMLYCYCWEEEPGAQLISAATTFDQAKIIWNISRQMVDKTPDLREAFGLETWAKSISRAETGASFKPLHAKASTQDGLNPSHTSLDEIHAHKTPDLLNVLQSAAGARSNPLWLFTTTEGYTNPGPWADIRHFAKQLLSGVIREKDGDHYLAVFFAVDEDDEEFDENAWVKANPLIHTNPNLLEAIRKEAVEAKHMPSKLAEFRIKRLNRPASAADGWIDLQKWQACDGEVDLDWLRQYPCYGGLDLASTSDLTSFRLVWLVDGIYYTHAWRWVPDAAVAQRTERGTVPYQSWVEEGLLLQTEGNVTDYAVIESCIREQHEKFNIVSLAYDRWNATEMVGRLVDDNLPMLEFVQGTKSYHPAMQSLEVAYMSGKIAHGGDPILNWCASNLVARRDQNLNMAPDKRKSADKIDDMCSFLMAVGVAQTAEEPKPIKMFVLG